jgi:hypothetical protein
MLPCFDHRAVLTELTEPAFEIAHAGRESR